MTEAKNIFYSVKPAYLESIQKITVRLILILENLIPILENWPQNPNNLNMYSITKEKQIS